MEGFYIVCVAALAIFLYKFIKNVKETVKKEKEEKDLEVLRKVFLENISPMWKDKEALDDEEIVDFYMGVCAEIALSYSKGEIDELKQ